MDLMLCEKWLTVNFHPLLSYLFQEFWSPSVCVDFCSRFLRLVKHEMSHVDSPVTVYRFEYDPSRYDSIQVSTHMNDPDLRMLPDWYIDVLNKCAV